MLACLCHPPRICYQHFIRIKTSIIHYSSHLVLKRDMNFTTLKHALYILHFNGQERSKHQSAGKSFNLWENKRMIKQKVTLKPTEQYWLWVKNLHKVHQHLKFEEWNLTGRRDHGILYHCFWFVPGYYYESTKTTAIILKIWW